MLAGQKEVLELIPQKPPMAMVDGLIYNDTVKTTSQLVLSKVNIFCKSGFFQEAGIIENIAQTAALHSGYLDIQSGEKPKTGFIGSIKRLNIIELPTDTDTLQSTVIILHELMNATVIRGEVFVNNKLMAEGEMNIFFPASTSL